MFVTSTTQRYTLLLTPPNVLLIIFIHIMSTLSGSYNHNNLSLPLPTEGRGTTKHKPETSLHHYTRYLVIHSTVLYKYTTHTIIQQLNYGTLTGPFRVGKVFPLTGHRTCHQWSGNGSHNSSTWNIIDRDEGDR
ncbi:hypothetical protein UFOVP185_23 [uncultured Caudovirales phage]|uniref:Uncharacterized protein n=1 Tax=uncultured Caudovirales phage TaxID=2100421 RepID=A0A6J7WG53_9CAUD|nr:hypothetical protein UFOVP185_23 [uncultured Caudovirales phage]